MKVITYKDLYTIAEKENIIAAQVLNIFKELDITTSVTTQASLNEMLVTIYKRIKCYEDVEFEGLGHMTPDMMKSWVTENLGTYSSNLFIDSAEKYDKLVKMSGLKNSIKRG